MKRSCFLLLFGFLPSKREFDNFNEVLRDMYALPDDFLEMNLFAHAGTKPYE